MWVGMRGPTSFTALPACAGNRGRVPDWRSGSLWLTLQRPVVFRRVWLLGGGQDPLRLVGGRVTARRDFARALSTHPASIALGVPCR
eukprot:4571515-Alexandrium_andersonii.AAC.1